MPRCFSISIQSEVAWRPLLRALTVPAIWIAPENSSSFSVSVVLPASGWEMMPKVRRRCTSRAMAAGALAALAPVFWGCCCDIVGHGLGHLRGFCEKPSILPFLGPGV